MCTLSIHAERNSILDDVEDILLNVEVLDDFPQTVTTADHREDFQESEACCNSTVLEKVGTGAEYRRLLAQAQHNHRIHQCIAVIGSQDYGAVSRDVLESFDF